MNGKSKQSTLIDMPAQIYLNLVLFAALHSNHNDIVCKCVTSGVITLINYSIGYFLARAYKVSNAMGQILHALVPAVH